MKNILVTGAAGFLGTNLCLRLLDDGHEVLGLDDLSSGQKTNLEILGKNPKFKFIEKDIVKNLGDFDSKFDEIWNLACPASPPRYQADPVQTFKTSVIGCIQLAELAINHGAKLFHSSTSEVYGDPLVHPQPESYWGNVNPIGIRSCYDEGKRAAETYLMDMHRHKGLKLKLVRIFNTYGPFMDPEDGRVVSNFILQVLRGEKITVYGDGKQTRSFCYVDDLIEGFIKFMDTEDSFTGPMNLGNPGEFTMLELAEIVQSKLGVKSEIVHLELPKDDPLQRKPDISLAGEKLNWTPNVALEEGLEHTIEYYRNLK